MAATAAYDVACASCWSVTVSRWATSIRRCTRPRRITPSHSPTAAISKRARQASESPLFSSKKSHQAFGTFHRDALEHGIHDIIVICHGVTLRAFVMMWCHLSPEWFEAERN